MSLTGVSLYFAKFFDENGIFIKNVYFDKFKPIFHFRKKAFNVMKEASYYEDKGLFWDKRFYFYNISNTNPHTLDKKCEPILEPELYNILLETDTAKKLNESHLKFNLDFKTILIIGAFLIGGYWVITKGGFF